MTTSKKNKWLNIWTQLKSMADQEWNKRQAQKETYLDEMPKASTLSKEKAAQLSDYLFEFKKNWNKTEKEKILNEQPVVKGFYDFLVPDQVSEKDFWQRYGYRCNKEQIVKDFEALPKEEFAKLVEAASEHSEEKKSRAWALPSKKTARLPEILKSPMKSVNKPVYDRSAILKKTKADVSPSNESSTNLPSEKPGINPIYVNVLKATKAQPEATTPQADEQTDAILEREVASERRDGSLLGFIEESPHVESLPGAVSPTSQSQERNREVISSAPIGIPAIEECPDQLQTAKAAEGQPPPPIEETAPQAEMLLSPSKDSGVINEPPAEASQLPHEKLTLEVVDAPVSEAASAPQVAASNEFTSQHPKSEQVLDDESMASDIDSLKDEIIVDDKTPEAYKTTEDYPPENQSIDSNTPELAILHTEEVNSINNAELSKNSVAFSQILNVDETSATVPLTPTPPLANQLEQESGEHQTASSTLQEAEMNVLEAPTSPTAQIGGAHPIPDKASILSKLSESFLSPGTLKQIGSILDKKAKPNKEAMKATIAPPSIDDSLPGDASKEPAGAEEAKKGKGTDSEKGDVMKRLSNALFSPNTHQKALDMEKDAQRLLVKEKLKELGLDFESAMDEEHQTQDMLVKEASSQRERTGDAKGLGGQEDVQSKSASHVDAIQRVSEIIFSPEMHSKTLDLERDQKKRMIKERLQELDLNFEDGVEDHEQTEEMLVAQVKDKLAAPFLNTDHHDVKEGATTNEADSLDDDPNEKKIHETFGASRAKEVQSGLFGKFRESFSSPPKAIRQVSLQEEKAQQLIKLKLELADLNDDIDVSMSSHQRILGAKKCSVNLELAEAKFAEFGEEREEMVHASIDPESSSEAPTAKEDQTAVAISEKASTSDSNKLAIEQDRIASESSEARSGLQGEDKPFEECHVFDPKDTRSSSSSKGLFGWWGNSAKETAKQQEEPHDSADTESDPKLAKDVMSEKHIERSTPGASGAFSFLTLPKTKDHDQDENVAVEEPDVLQFGPEAAEEDARMKANDEESRLKSEAQARVNAEEEAIQQAQDEEAWLNQEENLRQQAEEDARIKFGGEKNRIAGEEEERRMAEEDARLKVEEMPNHAIVEQIARDQAEEAAREAIYEGKDATDDVATSTSPEEFEEVSGPEKFCDTGAAGLEATEDEGFDNETMAQDEVQPLEKQRSSPRNTTEENAVLSFSASAHEDHIIEESVPAESAAEKKKKLGDDEIIEESTQVEVQKEDVACMEPEAKAEEEQYLSVMPAHAMKTPPTINGVSVRRRTTPQEREEKRQRVKALVRQLDSTLQKNAALGQ